MIRRLFDIAVASITLSILAIPFLFVAVAIKLSSPGPVFFVQRRAGRWGRIFGLYKFRTMRPGNSGPAVTAQGDPRITPIGSILRRWKIDELPQFWNVLKGDMSIVGPRPEVERFVQLYTPEQRRILDVKPGLAGMAQIVFSHEAESLEGSPDPEREYLECWMPRKIAVDLEYEKSRGLGTDLLFLAEIALLVAGYRRRQAEVPTSIRAEPGAAAPAEPEAPGCDSSDSLDDKKSRRQVNAG